MIKKHVLTCVLALVALLGSKLFIFSTPVKSELETTQQIKAEKAVERHRKAFKQELLGLEEERKEAYYSNLNFAGETLPQYVTSVEKRLKRNLDKFSYSNLKTHRLHRVSQDWFPIIEDRKRT